MAHKGKFKRVDRSDKPMYGPRALLLCGWPEEERTGFIEMIEGLGVPDLSVVFATSRDLDATVGDLLAAQDKTGLGEGSAIKRAVVMSGLSRNELHILMAAYRKAGLPRPLWASLTPVSEHWPLKVLLEELEKESKQMEKGRK